MRRARVKQSRRRVGEVAIQGRALVISPLRMKCYSPFAHEVVGFDRTIDVFTMDTHSNAHQHVLRTLSYASINTEKIGSLESLESEA